jgi:hypothetical protein
MTANQIVMKLNRLLAEPVDDECKVVYLLAEVRKLLDPMPAAQRPPALNLYCHWALHIDLHGKDTLTPFLQEVDAYAGRVLTGDVDLVADDRMTREFLYFDRLRSQLQKFLRDCGVRTDVTDNEDRWHEFVTHYAGVIEDGRLAIRAQNHGLKHVRQVTFMKGRDSLGEFNALPFQMVWRIELLEGQRLKGFDVDVSARHVVHGTNEMIGTSISLR